KSNAPVKIVQSLARHSTPTLTLGCYAHVGLFDQSAALDALPDLTRPTQTPQNLAKTGTEGPFGHRQSSDPTGPAEPGSEYSGTEGQARSKAFGHHLATEQAVSVRDCAPVDVIGGSERGASNPALDGSQPSMSQGLDALVRGKTQSCKRRGWDSNPR